MKNDNKISQAVIKRLPRYRRYLEDLNKRGVERISSGALAESIGYTASQIRQDLNNFGGFGQQGYGYNVKELYNHISIILGLDKKYSIIVVGFGNLGEALTNFIPAYRDGYKVAAIFDIDPDIIGRDYYGIKVNDSNELIQYLKENPTDIAIITTPKSSAQEIADQLAEGGVKGIWNFAPAEIEVPKNISLENAHLSDSLHSLIYYINHPE